MPFYTPEMGAVWYGIWIIGGIWMIIRLIDFAITSAKLRKQAEEDEKTLDNIARLIIERCELAKKQYATMQEGVEYMKSALELQINVAKEIASCVSTQPRS